MHDSRWIFRAISLIALLAAVFWSGTVRWQESRHTGEPLPEKTLAQIVTTPAAMPAFLHVQGATVDFSAVWIDDHYCYRTHCVDTYNPLVTPHDAHPARVAALSLIERLPGDVNEARHPFDPHDPVIEGQVQADPLSPRQVHGLRAHGIPVDEQTVVIQRAALRGRVPGPESVDELIPFLLGLPVAFVAGLLGFRRFPIQLQRPDSRSGRR